MTKAAIAIATAAAVMAVAALAVSIGVSRSRWEAVWCGTPGGWSFSWLRCRFLEGCSRECWIVSAGYRRRQAEGGYNHDLAKRGSTLQGVALSSMRFHPTGRGTRAMTTDKKGALRLQTHPSSNRPEID